MMNRFLNVFVCSIFFFGSIAAHSQTAAKKAADEARARLDGLAAVDLCYTLAASNLDVDRPVGYPGVPYAEVEGDRAAEACSKAVAYRPGDAGLQCNYGRALDAAKRFEEAVRWYRKAAEQDYTRALNNLGMKYAFGEGVAKDYAEAAQWYRKAADKGDALAQRSLGDLYYNGQGVAQDYAQATYWYQMVNAKEP